MEINRLHGDELAYELCIRNLPLGNTVEEKRNLLREVFRKERLNVAVAPSIVYLDPENEFTICFRKIEELNLAIASFDQNNRQNEFKRIYSRLLHVSLRLNRISCHEESQVKVRSDLVAKCTQLIGDLNLVYEGLSSSQVELGGNVPHVEEVPHLSLLDEDNPLIPEVVHPLNVAKGVSYDLVDIPVPRSEGTPRHRVELLSGETVTQPPPPRVTCFPRFSSEEISHGCPGVLLDNGRGRAPEPHVRFAEATPQVPRSSRPSDRRFCAEDIGGLNTSVPVDNLRNRLDELHFHPVQTKWPAYEVTSRFPDIARWNLRYNGRTSVKDFLERVEELRISRGATKEQLLRSAPELFTQDALIWYRTKYFESWNDLVFQLKEAFQPYDYEYMLWDEIRRRTQGAQEKVINFVSAIENLFRKLTQLPSEETRLNLIKRNLLPYIQMQLATHPIYSISELVRLSRAIEETDMRVQRFVPPPNNYRGLLEPELAYRRPSNQVGATVSALQGVADTQETSRRLPTATSPTSTTFTSITAAGNTPSTCWNCGSIDHRFRACDKPRKMFCFRCGFANVKVSTCPNCPKNDRRGHH